MMANPGMNPTAHAPVKKKSQFVETMKRLADNKGAVFGGIIAVSPAKERMRWKSSTARSAQAPLPSDIFSFTKSFVPSFSQALTTPL